MTVENQDNKKRVQGNGSTVDIPFSFRVLEESDLKVYYVTRATNVAVLKTQDVDYTVALDDDGEGGTVTTTVAQASTIDILLLNQLEYTQPADLPTEGNFNETAVETALDRCRLIDIQIKEEVTRCLKLKVEDVLNTTAYGGLFFTAEATADRQDRVVKWNAAGTELEAGPETTSLDEILPYLADIDALAAVATDIDALGGIAADITLVAANVANIAAAVADLPSLAAKVSKTGDTMSGDLRINAKLGIGVAPTEEIHIKQGTGDISIRLEYTGLADFFIQNNGSGVLLGPVGTQAVYLYSNGQYRGLLVDSNGAFCMGSQTPTTSCILEAISTTRAFATPRMTTTQKNAIATPSAGMEVFDTTMACKQVYNGSAWVAPVTITTYQATPANPAGTTSATAVMMAIGGAITPIRSGKVEVIISGTVKNSNSGNGATTLMKYGTGTAPVNGAAVTGTSIGNSFPHTNLNNGNIYPFSHNAIISGLTLGTAIWADLSLLASTGGTATVENLSISIKEI